MAKFRVKTYLWYEMRDIVDAETEDDAVDYVYRMYNTAAENGAQVEVRYVEEVE